VADPDVFMSSSPTAGFRVAVEPGDGGKIIAGFSRSNGGVAMRIAIVCGSLCLIPLVGCSAIPHSNATDDSSASDRDSLGYYNETAHKDAVKNLWFGLDAPSTNQDEPAH
jgi:hypothetical protein